MTLGRNSDGCVDVCVCFTVRRELETSTPRQNHSWSTSVERCAGWNWMNQRLNGTAFITPPIQISNFCEDVARQQCRELRVFVKTMWFCVSRHSKIRHIKLFTPTLCSFPTGTSRVTMTPTRRAWTRCTPSTWWDSSTLLVKIRNALF